MASRRPTHFLTVGAGAAGLMVGRALARAGKRVTILEARDRLGGRILALPAEEFGYAAEGGPEFVHGAAPVTRAVMREARLRLLPRRGRRWSKRSGRLVPDDSPLPHAHRFYEALLGVTEDLPVAEFLARHFSDPRFDELRRSIIRTVEGYDAADPGRMSTLALREEWMARDDGEHGRLADGYGAMIDYLARDCRAYGGTLHLGAEIVAIEQTGDGIVARCRDGATFEADAAVLSVPLPLLGEITLPGSARERAATAVDIGYGNVVKHLYRFATKWWEGAGGHDFADLSFVISNASVPTWWTQHPAAFPVLTGWYAGPKADRVAALSEAELIEMGLASLAEIFEVPIDRVRRQLVTARAINWGNDPFARGAYSYATTNSRAAQAALKDPGDGTVFFTGEALYAGPDMGTVEAALASGEETVCTILRSD